MPLVAKGVRRSQKPETKAALAKLDPEVRALFPDELVDKVQCIIDEGNRSGERVSGHEQIHKLTYDAGLATHRQERPEFCAIDPANRNSFGASGANAQDHGDKCLKAGWSTEKTKDAEAFDMPPVKTDIAKANREFEALSNGLIPPLKDFHISTVGTTHTTVFLRQVKAGVKAVVDSLADEHGNVSKDFLGTSRPNFVRRGTRPDIFRLQPRLRHGVAGVEAILLQSAQQRAPWDRRGGGDHVGHGQGGGGFPQCRRCR